MSKEKKKYIVVPPDLEIEVGWDVDGKAIKQKFTFYRHFLRFTVLSDQQKFGANMDAVYTGMAIRGAFDGKEAGDRVHLPIDHLNKLQEAVRNPSSPYNPSVMMQCDGYFKAIMEPVELEEDK